MKIIVDTCIWSLAFRRNAPGSNYLVEELTELISEVRVQLARVKSTILFAKNMLVG